MRYFALAIALAAIGQSSSAQQALLPVDAEYMGALLNSAAPFNVTFYANGRVLSAYLKTDYARDGYTYTAGSLIFFHESGRVQRGQLKNEAKAWGFVVVPGNIEFNGSGAPLSATVKKGQTDANLAVDYDSTVQFDAQGHLLTLEPVVAPSSIRILDRSIRGGVSLAWDKTNGGYLLTQGTVAAPQLIARIVTKWSQLGQPVELLPVVVPAVSTFRVQIEQPGEVAPTVASWFVSTPYTLGTMNFGTNARLLVRDMRLRGVQVSQAVTVGGIQFQPGQVVTFDDAGRVVPPTSSPG